MRRHIPLTLACLLFGLSLLAIGLWPFNFRVDNHSVLVPNDGGIKFEASAERSKQDLGGMVFTPNPLACRDKSSCEAGALTIEIELLAENEVSPCIKRIVELRRSDASEAFWYACGCYRRESHRRGGAFILRFSRGLQSAWRSS